MFSYIDPGTGSMLFTVLIGIIGAAVYSIRMFVLKMKAKLGGGKVEDSAERKDIVIFSDNKRYWQTFEPIVRELGKLGRSVTYLTGSEDDPALSCGYENVEAEYIGSGNKMFARLNNLNAVILFSTTPGLDVYQWKRSSKVKWYVHIAHAPNDITLYRMFGIDYYDAILLSGAYQTDEIRTLESVRSLPAKEIEIVGIPYLDEMAKRVQEAGKCPDHPRTVLLAPSWGKSAIFGVYGGKIIDVLLETGYHIIIRPHPQSFQSEAELMDKLMKEYPESDRLEWNRDTDNFEVLRRSDILISDFSGVTFEFSLVHDKPIIYTDPNFDLSPYDAWWIKDPLWTVGALPRIGRRLSDENMSDLKELIDECISDPAYAEGRRAVKAETWEHAGEGAALAAGYLDRKLVELKKEDA